MNDTPKAITDTVSVARNSICNVSDLQSPYGGSKVLDWNSLPEIDRCIYLHQKGAPSDSNTLLVDWQEVKGRLFEEGLITFDHANSPEATCWVAVRYEHVRLALMSYFETREIEPINNEQWIVFHTEGLDVYDSRPGRKYFRHQEEAVVHPQVSKACSAVKTEPILVMEPLEYIQAPIRAQGAIPSLNLDLESHQSIWCRTAKIDDIFSHTSNSFLFEQPLPLATSTEPSPSLEMNRAEAALLENMKTVATSTVPIFEYQRDDSIFDGLGEDTATPQDHQVTIAPDSVTQRSITALNYDTLPKRPQAGLKLGASDPIIGVDATVLTDEAIPSHWQIRPSAIFMETKAPPASYISVNVPKSSRRKEADNFTIHEDYPSRTPDTGKGIADYPTSPGTDIPKENISSQERIETSNETRASLTPRSRYGRTMNVTPGQVAPYRSIFGGS